MLEKWPGCCVLLDNSLCFATKLAGLHRSSDTFVTSGACRADLPVTAEPLCEVDAAAATIRDPFSVTALTPFSGRSPPRRNPCGICGTNLAALRRGVSKKALFGTGGGTAAVRGVRDDLDKSCWAARPT